jgi:predicted nucleic acid-binding protein
LDTNVLINHWRRFGEKNRTTDALRSHAEELVELQGTNLIASPVLVEFLVGARTGEVLDKGDIPRQDWQEAERLAKWIRTNRPRKLGDCLIEAIAKRYNGDIVTGDPDFKWRVPPR